MTADYLKKLFIVVCVVAVALIAASCKKNERNVVVEEGKAPDFTLSDIRGTKVTLSGLRGKVVMLEFWATWCPPCRDSIPDLNRVYEKFKDKNFELLAISVDEGRDVSSTVGSFMKEHGVIYPVLIDDGKVNQSYGVTNIPVMFIIGKDGKVVKKHIGYTGGLAEKLSREIEALL